MRLWRAAGELRFPFAWLFVLVPSSLALSNSADVDVAAVHAVMTLSELDGNASVPATGLLLLLRLLYVGVPTTRKQNDSSCCGSFSRSCKLRNLLGKRCSLLLAPGWLDR